MDAGARRRDLRRAPFLRSFARRRRAEASLPRKPGRAVDLALPRDQLGHGRAVPSALLWSSFGEGGYVQALAHSDTDGIDGHWTVDRELLFDRDGGHGMIFRDFAGQYTLTLHSPNKTLDERPVFRRLLYENGAFRVCK